MVRPAKLEESPASGGKLGRYRLLMELGQGGMGTIHLAIATGTGDFRKLVVLKELREERVNDALFVDMFMREAMLAGRLNHANVVQTIEAARDGKRLFLAMEFLDGQPLAQVMRAAYDSRLPQRALLQLICDALAGLHYAHELKDYGGSPLGIVHCDVSPQNIFVTYDGNVKVVDFGVARARGAEDLEGGFRGRLAYAAPEQICSDDMDGRTDVFAMGVILWEVLAQQRLVAPGTPSRETVARRLSGREPSISEVVPTVPTELGSICDKALQLKAADRFASADEFRQALASYVHRTGGPPDSAEISSFMSEKFGEQRRALHQLIHDHLEDEDTAIKDRSIRFEFEVGNDDVTRVGDLSPLVDLTRSEETDAIARGLRPNRSRFIFSGLGAAIVVVGIGAWAMLSGNGETPHAVDVAGQQPLMDQSRTALASDKADHATTGTALQADEPVAAREAAVVTAEQQPEASEEEEASDEEEDSSQERAASSPRSPRRAVVRPPSSRGVPDPKGVKEAPVAANPPTSLPPPTAGQDLSKRREPRRELDENPFR